MRKCPARRALAIRNPGGLHLSVAELSLLTATGVLTAALTAIAGFGGGTILMAALLQFMGPAAAMPIHGVVQLFSNGWRVLLFRRHISPPLLWRFLVFLPFGVWLGSWFFQGLTKEAIQAMIGEFVLGSLFTRQLKGPRDNDLPLWAFFPLGFVTGVLNMMVGVVAPLTGVLTIRKELNEEALIAIPGSFSLAGHSCKLIAFGLIGFRFGGYLVPILVMAPTVMLGGYLGKRILGWFSEALFQLVFNLLLAGLGLKLVFWDAAMRPWQ